MREAECKIHKIQLFVWRQTMALPKNLKEKNIYKCAFLWEFAYRNHHDVVLQEDLISTWGGGSIGALSNNLTKTSKHLTTAPTDYATLKSFESRWQLKKITASHLSFDSGGIIACELLFSGSRDQDVAVSLQNAPFIRFGSWEAHNGAMLLHKRNTNITKMFWGKINIQRW